MRCLVVDDNPDDRELVERMIVRNGHLATLASGGQAALRALETMDFDIVVMDLGMPGMTGAETIRQMRAKNPRLKVLVVSSFEDPRHVLEAIDAGAIGYLLKTELAARFGQALQEVMAGQSPLSSSIAVHIVRRARGAAADGSGPMRRDVITARASTDRDKPR